MKLFGYSIFMIDLGRILRRVRNVGDVRDVEMLAVKNKHFEQAKRSSNFIIII